MQTIRPICQIDTILNDISLKRVNRMKSQLHQCAFLSVRYLLSKADYNDDDLFYTEDGKPHLKDGQEISITHSHNFSAIIISNTPVGIDIEKKRDKIIRIASKFVGIEKEKDYFEISKARIKHASTNSRKKAA